jgi:hypothetical protein
MPRPQAGTPTDVALADVDTNIRVGIGAHSVRIRLHGVKYGPRTPPAKSPRPGRCREHAATGLPRAPRSSTLPGSMVAGTRSKPFGFAIRAIAAFIQPR